MKIPYSRKVTIGGYPVVKNLIIAERFYFTFFASSHYRPTFAIHQKQGKNCLPPRNKYFGVKTCGYHNAFESARKCLVDCKMLTEEETRDLVAPCLNTMLIYRQYYIKNFRHLVPLSDVFKMFDATPD